MARQYEALAHSAVHISRFAVAADDTHPRSISLQDSVRFDLETGQHVD